MKRMMSATRAVLTVAGFCAALGVQGASAQGFFESLFGGGPQEGRSSWGPSRSDFAAPDVFSGGSRRRSTYTGTLDPDDPRLHREIRRRAAKPVVRTLRPAVDGVSATRQVAVVATEDAPRGSLAYFAKDKTLRAGDVVVTDNGFLIYQGGDHASPKSFAALGKVGAGRANLVALESVSTMRTPNVEIETISALRDFVGPRTQAQMEQEAELKKLSVTASR